jgi:hypothetical protein
VLIASPKSNSNVYFSFLRDGSEKVNLSIITRYAFVSYDNRALSILLGRVLLFLIALLVHLYNILVILSTFLKDFFEIPVS